MMHRRSLVGVALTRAAILFVIAGLFPLAASGQGITEIIALTGAAPPEGNGTFSTFKIPALNNAGQTAILATLSGTSGGANDDTGIYRGEASAGTLTKIAREKPQIILSSGLTNLGSPAINSSGELAFLGTRLSATSGPLDRVYRGAGGALTPIATEGNAAPDGNGTFLEFTSPALNDTGQTAFFADLTGTSGGTNDNSGIYRGESPAGSLTRIAREKPQVILSSGLTNLGSPAINSSGELAFRGTLLSPTSGSLERIYRGSGGGLTAIATEGNAAPDGNGNFSGLGFPALNDAGQAAFHANLTGTNGGASDNSGIFRGTGGAITQIARKGTAAPDGNGEFSSFGSPSLNASGQAAFVATLTGTSGGTSDDFGIFRGAGGAITQIAREGAAAPDGNGEFLLINFPALNASGQVAFFAFLSGTSGGASDNVGIFLANGIDTIQVAREGEKLAGNTIAALSINDSADANGDERSGINDNGQVAYRATLRNGDHAIVRFTIPDLHWTSPASGSWDTNTNWSNSIQPISFHDTFIDPANDVNVIGPGGIAHAKSLAVGGGGGQATLSLQSSGLLTVIEGVNVAANGAIAGEGTIVADVTSAGSIDPGSSIGAITIDGDYSQTGTLSMELASLSGVDTLTVTGAATLAGTLDVSLLGGFTPSAGDMFEILTATDVIGTFDIENLPDVGGLVWNVLYGATNVALEVVSPFTADLDGDGDVDGNDFLLIQRNDPSLISQWQSEYGSGVPSFAASQAVPEPSAIWLILAGFIHCFAGRNQFGHNP